MKNKLALGTVQFGQKYGISNISGEVSISEISKILSYAIEHNIDYIDTAKAYGNSEVKLGKFDLTSFKLITKLSNLNNSNADIADSITKLKIKNLYAVLVHNFNQFLANQDLYNEFLSSNDLYKSKKIGFSLNKTSELDYLLANNIKFNIVQVPYNVLDQRFGLYFKELTEKGIEIHTRSVFLQGLFFLEFNKVPIRIKELLPALQELHEIAIKNSLTIEEVSLNFALFNHYISKVVIGVTSLEELKLNINAINKFNKIKYIYSALLKLKIDEERLVLPMNWN